MRILIVYDNSLTSNLLCRCLRNGNADTRTFESNGNSLAEDYRIFKPDIVIMGSSSTRNLVFRDYQEFTLSGRLNQSVAFVLLVNNPDPKETCEILGNRVVSVVHEDDGLDCIIEGMEAAKGKRQYLSPLIRTVVPLVNHPGISLLSQSEIQIARLLLKGYNTHQISKQLCRSQDTVKNHRKALKAKLGIRGGKNSLMKNLIYLGTLFQELTKDI